MASALKLPPRRMTVAEFLEWDPEDGSGARWQLRDGEPEMMAPAPDRHSSIQAELARLIGNALVDRNSRCRVATEAGVIPRVRAASPPRFAAPTAPPA